MVKQVTTVTEPSLAVQTQPNGLTMSSPTPADTIAAIATPPGTGAVSMIRLSGPQAIEIAAKATDATTASQPSRYARHCRITGDRGDIIDDGILTVFRAPRSFTGEDCVEFTGHGGMVVTANVLSRFLTCGARSAGPGEFARRAFMNGKMDLTQAEGIMDLISAQSTLAVRAARNQLEGELGKRTVEIRDAVMNSLAHLEAWIDFPEEDIDPVSGKELQSGVVRSLEDVRALLATADQGRLLREGVRTVIFGEPNVGKSSLLNRLLGFERAIVSEAAGTTRDTIEETVLVGGLPLKLVDTAGIRDADDPVEAMGIRRTNDQVSQADLLLEVFDASLPPPQPSENPFRTERRLLLLNKSDLGEHPGWQNVQAIRISCIDRRGFDQLTQALQEVLCFGEFDWGNHAVAINARHQECLRRAATSLDHAIQSLDPLKFMPELASIDLRDALDALGEIPGKLDTEDLLGAIFSQFCIGK